MDNIRVFWDVMEAPISARYAEDHLNNTKQLVVYIDKHRRVVYYNQRTKDYVEEIHGKKTSILGTIVESTFPEFNHVMSRLSQVIATNKALDFEEFFIPVQRWYWFHIFPSRVNDTFCIVCQEIPKVDSETMNRSVTKVQDYTNLILDITTEAIITINKWNKVVQWNKAAESIFGWKSDEVFNKSLSNLIIPQDKRQDHEESIKNFLKTKKSDKFNIKRTLPALHKLGHKIVIEIVYTWHLFRGESYFTASIKDITEEAKKEETFAQNKSVFNAVMTVIEQAGIHFYIMDKQGRYTYYNSHSAAFLERAYGASVLGKTNREVFSTQVAKEFEDVDKRVVSTGKPVTKKSVLTFGGQSKIFISSIVPLKDTHGEIQGSCGLSWDTTEETDRVLMLEGLMNIIEKSKFSFYVKDTQGHIIYTNDHVASGLPPIIQGKTKLKDLFPDADLTHVQETEKQVLSGETLLTTERLGKRSFVVTRTPRKDSSGKVIGLYGLAQEVTEFEEAMAAKNELEIRRLQMSQKLAQEASQLKSEFLANMSHEIRTPLNGIVGLLTLLEVSNLTHDQREFVLGIRQSTGKLLSIVNDILDFSKIESGKIQLEYSSFNISSLVTDLTMMHSFYANQKGLEFVLQNNIDAQHAEYIGDYGRLRQVLNNILNNAIKFTKEGKVLLTSSYVKETNSYTFTIQDTGIGISPDNLKKLYKPFTQGDASMTKEHSGTGLGLSIAHDILKIMDGTISVDSELGKGSTFTVTIPYVKGETSSEQLTTTTATSSSQESQLIQVVNPKDVLQVLVVEDNPMNRKVAIKLLQHMGYNAVGCENGKEAVDLLTMYPKLYGLVLMDLSMPVMNGYDATKAIREMPPPVGRIPIVAMTANVLHGERERTLAAGMNDYIAKPFRAQTLKEKVQRWILATSRDDMTSTDHGPFYPFKQYVKN